MRACSCGGRIEGRLKSGGWRVDKDPAPLGGVTFVPTDSPDPGPGLSFGSFLSVVLHHLEDYSVRPERLRERQRQYAHIYILEKFFP